MSAPDHAAVKSRCAALASLRCAARLFQTPNNARGFPACFFNSALNVASASVALQYRHSQQVLISALGNYAGTRSSDGLIDTTHVGGKGRLAWDLQQSQTWTTLISFEAGYNRMTHHVTSSAETEDISGLIRLVLAAL